MKIRNFITFHFLRFIGYDPINIVTFLLHHEEISRAFIAKQLNVTPQYVTLVLANKRYSKEIHRAITEALGFSPWA